MSFRPARRPSVAARGRGPRLAQAALATAWMALALGLPSFPARADLPQDGGAWFAFVGQGDFAGAPSGLAPLRWWFDGQARFRDGSAGYDQGVIRPGLGFAFGEGLSVWVGYAWLHTSPSNVPDIEEDRAWQQLLWRTQNGDLSFQSRSRLEQRFVSSGSGTGWRYRQLVKLGYPLPLSPRLSLVGLDELFFDLNSTDWGARAGFSQNRLFVGLSWRFDDAGRWVGEIGYQNQYIRSRGSEAMNHLARVQLLFDGVAGRAP